MVLSKGLPQGRGLPESVVVALKVKFTTREFWWANSTWMCSAPPTPLFRNSFPGGEEEAAGGKGEGEEKCLRRGGVDAVEYARCLVIGAMMGDG